MTVERETLTTRFLAQAGWGSATRVNLAGDASMRRYERLHKSQTDETAVLMDAPPGANASIRPFVTIARHLNNIGLSAPRINCEDEENGFLLMEDLGDDLFSRTILAVPRLELPLYTTATDVLISLHCADMPSLTVFGPELMAKQANLVFETWVQTITGSQDPTVAAEFCTCFQAIIHQTTDAKQVMILRDYHADNLLWLPDRAGVARVGLLDFQDAMLAHPAYDLVSLLQDVRRDVSADVEQAMIAHYISHTGQDDHTFHTAYAVLSVQRNLRILAVFARLAGTLGKPFYASLIPRTWAHLLRGLDHPALAPVAQLLIDVLPQPTTPNLQKLIAI
jgi:aminoglycoside/choline kinase family phosphotransferase